MIIIVNNDIYEITMEISVGCKIAPNLAPLAMYLAHKELLDIFAGDNNNNTNNNNNRGARDGCVRDGLAETYPNAFVTFSNVEPRKWRK